MLGTVAANRHNLKIQFSQILMSQLPAFPTSCSAPGVLFSRPWCLGRTGSRSGRPADRSVPVRRRGRARGSRSFRCGRAPLGADRRAAHAGLQRM